MSRMIFCTSLAFLLSVATITLSSAQTRSDKDACNWDYLPELNEDRYSLSPLEQKWLDVRKVWSRSRSLIESQKVRLENANKEAGEISKRRLELVSRKRDLQKQMDQFQEIRNQYNILLSDREKLENKPENKDKLKILTRQIEILERPIKNSENLQNQISRVENEPSERLPKEVDAARKAVVEAEDCLSYLTSQFKRSEDKISSLLIPESQRSDFKLLLSFIYACIVFRLIAGFYYIAHKDPIVRQTIFSRHVGIQFITLFSLVIAIILFGILEILKDKELAALLGGISGYILGRTGSDKRDGETHSPVTVTSKNISFSAPNMIDDAGGALAAFKVGDRIQITGSKLNDAIYSVATITTGSLTVHEQTIKDENAGRRVTIQA